MRECDKDLDGRLSFEEFRQYIMKANNSLIEKISVHEIL
jgi:Ca2+-binding EF-hand superfamily protein